MGSMDFASIDSYTFVDSSNDLALLVSDARGMRGNRLIFFVYQKCFGTGWSFQPVSMDV